MSSKNRLTSGGLDNRTIISKLVDDPFIEKVEYIPVVPELNKIHKGQSIDG